MTERKPKAPRHLAAPTRKWWESVVATYIMEPHHIKLLTLACEAFDRGTQARETLKKEKLTYLDRFGAPKSRPEIAVERDSRIAFARLLREIGLDANNNPDDARPPRGKV